METAAKPTRSAPEVFPSSTAALRLAAVLASTGDAVVAANPDGSVTDWNPAAEKVFGYTAREMVGHNIARLIPPDQREQGKTAMEQVLGSKSALSLEATRVRKDGTRILVASTLSPILNAEGAVVGLSGISRDITHQRELENQLRASQQEFQTIFAESNDMIFVLDPERDAIMDANPAACAKLGYTRDQLLALPPSVIHPREVPQLRAFLRDVDQAGKGWTNQLTCTTSRGAVLDAEISGSVAELGGRRLVVAIARDVTERRRQERESREREAQEQELRALRRLDRFRRDLLNLVAHELRTPLTPMRIHVHMLSSDPVLGRLGPPEQATVAALTRNLDRLSHVIDDIVSVVQADTPAASSQRSVVDLRTPVMAAVEASRLEATKRQVTIEIAAPSPVPLLLDESRTAHALHRLISTALDRLTDGEHLMVRCERDAQGILVEGRRTPGTSNGPARPVAATPGEVDLQYHLAHALLQIEGATVQENVDPAPEAALFRARWDEDPSRPPKAPKPQTS